MKKLSIVIPAKNEEGNISVVLKELHKTLSAMPYQSEIIVVDDKSSDNTADVAIANKAVVYKNEGPSGKGNALKLGFSKASGDYIVMMDADCSHRAEDLPLFIEQLEKGAGLVIGSRILGGSDEYTRIRAFGNIFLTWLFGFLMGRYLSDALNGYKAFKRELIDRHCYVSNNFEIEIELISKAIGDGLRIAEVPSHERVRASGKHKSSVCKDGLRFFARIIIEKFKLKFCDIQNKDSRN